MVRGTWSVVAVLAVVLVGFAPAAADTVVVSNLNMQGWVFLQETPSGTGAFAGGPATPPAGQGSANLTVNATGGMALAAAEFAGTPLASLIRIEYSTYRASGSPALAIALQLDMDFDLTDAFTGFQGRLVFEPYYTETVLTGAWQTWDATTVGKWWATRAPFNALCSIGSPCTWAQVLANWPNAGIRGGIFLKAGGGWASGFNGNVDALTIGVAGDDTTFDFELLQAATTKDQCKKGGWQSVYTADGEPFKNQGDCVSYVNHLP